jgi:hypothetical protein
MVAIATLSEFASFLQVDVDTATSNLLLLDLAQGLITDEIGDHNPWPSIAKSVALSAAGRAYVNPEGYKQEPGIGNTRGGIYNNPPNANGVFLSEQEKKDLHLWANGPGGQTVGQPQGSFPPPCSWPDPAQRNHWPSYYNQV